MGSVVAFDGETSQGQEHSLNEDRGELVKTSNNILQNLNKDIGKSFNDKEKELQSSLSEEVNEPGPSPMALMASLSGELETFKETSTLMTPPYPSMGTVMWANQDELNSSDYLSNEMCHNIDGHFNPGSPEVLNAGSGVTNPDSSFYHSVPKLPKMNCPYPLAEVFDILDDDFIDGFDINNFHFEQDSVTNYHPAHEWPSKLAAAPPLQAEPIYFDAPNASSLAVNFSEHEVASSSDCNSYRPTTPSTIASSAVASSSVDSPINLAFDDEYDPEDDGGGIAPFSALNNKNLGKIRRPPNAFMVFAKEKRRDILYTNNKLSNKEASRLLGQLWRGLQPQARWIYQEEARLLKEEHKRKYPDYVYSPVVARRAKEERMSKRKVPPKSSSTSSAAVPVKVARKSQVRANRRLAGVQASMVSNYVPQQQNYVPAFSVFGQEPGLRQQQQQQQQPQAMYFNTGQQQQIPAEFYQYYWQYYNYLQQQEYHQQDHRQIHQGYQGQPDVHQYQPEEIITEDVGPVLNNSLPDLIPTGIYRQYSQDDEKQGNHHDTDQ